MNLTELYNRINGQSALKLTADGLGEGGTTLYPFLSDISDTPIALTVSSGPTWSDASQNKFTVVGKAQNNLLGIEKPNIKLTAEFLDNAIHFRLQIDTLSNWTFGTSFPALLATEFNALSFSQPPYFVLSTSNIPTESLTKGLNLMGNLQLTHSVEALKQFIASPPNPMPIVGTIENQADFLMISLKAKTSDNVHSFVLPGLLTFQFHQPVLALYAYYYKKNPSFSLIKRIESEVDLVGKPGTKKVTLPLALQLPTLVTGWQIMLQPNRQTTLADFIEFLSLLASGGQFDLISILSDPSGKVNEVQRILKSLELKSFYVEIAGSLNAGPQFTSFSFDVQSTGNTWEIIKDKLALSNIRVFLKVSKENGKYNTAGFLQGELDIINNIAINGSIPLPVDTGVWRFSSRHPIPLSDFGILSKFVDNQPISGLLPAALGDLGGLQLTELSLSYDPKVKRISKLEVAVATAHTWVIIPDEFELVSIYIQFIIEKGANGWGLTGRISGSLMAGGIDIDTQLEKATTDSDWYFNLHANSIPLPSLEDLSRLTSSENTLADVLPESMLKAQLHFDNPRLEFNLSQKKLEAFGFSLVTDEIDFGEAKVIEAGIDVDINFSTEKKVKIYGRFSIAEIDFYVEGDYPGTGGWQFTGEAAISNPIKIGELINKLALKLGFSSDAPNAIKGLDVSNLIVTFNTQTKDFTFSVETKFPIDKKELDAVINIEITHNDGKYTRKFSGVVKVGDLEFDLIFQQEQDADTIFLAAFENKAGKDESIQPLVALITDNPDILNAAAGISFNLKDALLVIDKGQTTRILFGLDIGGGLDLSKMPLVGKMLPENASVRMTFQPLLTNQDFVEGDLNKIRTLVPAGGFQLPKEAKERLGFNMQLMISQQLLDFSLPIGVNDVKSQPATAALPTTNTPSTTNASAAPPATTGNVKWFVIQKQLGPIHFGRVGMQYEQSQLYFLLDASLSLAGLTISLDGLYASSTLKPIQPKFGLHGLGIDYKKGPLEIGGAFLRQTFTDKTGNTYDTYDGTAIIRTKKFALAALGSYAYYQGHPSLFIYAFLDIPLGGPAFFFVTGLAAGFGYNRRIVVPGINDIASFPLVAEAVSGVPDNKNDLSAEIQKLHDVIPPAVGEYFFAIGIKFNSFKIIDSFALLVVSFGSEFELDVLGLSTLVVPTPDLGSSIEPLAEVQLALQAVFNPDKGYLKVQAALTTASFIFSRKCHLTGGFAFYTWFKDDPQAQISAGDFVLTIGGYHPLFKVPAHYPKVAPLGLNWQVTSELIIKGNLYFALVPSAVMAGGHLSATYVSGNLKAWFNLSVDFIISWKPYFYDVSLYVVFGASYTFHLFGTHTISLELGADLHIWGPEFSGHASLHIWIFTVGVSFGAGVNQAPPDLNWDDFRKGFLPDIQSWESAVVTQGLTNQLKVGNQTLQIVTPKDLVIETNTALPITHFNGNKLTDCNTTIHIGSMGITADTDVITSNYKISVMLGQTDVTKDFSFAPIKKDVPGALWGKKLNTSTPPKGEELLVKNVCMGFTITGKPAKPSPGTHTVDSAKLLTEEMPFSKSAHLGSAPAKPNQEWLKNKGVKNKVSDSIELKQEARNTLLKELGFKDIYYPNKTLAEELVLTVA